MNLLLSRLKKPLLSLVLVGMLWAPLAPAVHAQSSFSNAVSGASSGSGGSASAAISGIGDKSSGGIFDTITGALGAGGLAECASSTIISGIASGIASCVTLGSGAVPVHDFKAQLAKGAESLGDTAMWLLINGILSQMTQSIVRWINTGFEGEPAFVTDPEAFFADALDQVSGAYIDELGLAGVLCSPFSLQIRISLLRQAQRVPHRYYCTLDRAIENLDGFYQNFQNGGWRTWVALTKEENSPYAQYINSYDELQRRRAAEMESKERELDWGDGFLSFRDETGKIATPGKIIQDKLGKALDVNTDRLILADSINEILGALVEQLLDKTLTSAAGILGLGGSNGNTQSSALANTRAALAAEAAQVAQNSASLVDADIAYEANYLAIKDAQLALLDTARSKTLAVRSCLQNATYIAPGFGVLPGVSSTSLAAIATSTNPSDAFAQVKNSFINASNDYLSKIDTATTTIAADKARAARNIDSLASYKTQIASAAGDGRALAAIMNDYQVYRTTSITGSGGVAIADNDRLTLESQLATANNTIDQVMVACQTNRLLEYAAGRNQ